MTPPLAIAIVVVLCFGAAGCKPRAHPSTSRESAADAALDAASDAAVAPVTSGPPPDDAIVPAPDDELVTRARHLLEAIAEDDPGRANDILFPRDGWLATRDATDPGKDWERQVAEPFRKAVHALSRRARGFGRASAVSVEIGRVLVQATPRRHGWKKPLWTVSGSRLTFVVEGHTGSLPVREMVGWRGAWYVTRLR